MIQRVATFPVRRQILRVSLFIGLLLSGVSTTSADVLPTAEQLVGLVSASRARYRSFDIEFNVQRFKSISTTMPSEPEAIALYTFRFDVDLDRILSRGTVIERDITGVSHTTTKSIAISRTDSRKLMEESHRFPVGTVLRGRIMEGELELDPVRAMWSPYGDDIWSAITNLNTKVERSNASGCLTLVANCYPRQSRIIQIDCQHGFLPCRQDIVISAGKHVQWCELSDLRQINDGLWMPFKYVAVFDSKIHVKSVFTVAKAQVNVNLKDADLGLVFPRGTYVHDQILDAQYKVGNDANMRGSEAQGPALGPTDFEPVHDEELQHATTLLPQTVMANSNSSPLWIYILLIAVVVIGSLLLWLLIRRNGKTSQKS